MTITGCPDQYSGADGKVRWHGVSLTDDTLNELRQNGLVDRALDAEFAEAVADEARALADTDMQTATLEQFIAGAEGSILSWQVGEAVAEVLLKEWHGAVWVWNGARDRKVRKASLPGADIVGFQTTGDAANPKFLFGEVKSSKDARTPPNVLHGRSGMISQLETLASGGDLWTLIKWLRARCTDDEHREMYQAAVRKWMATECRGVALVGCLLRDTAVAEADLTSRAKALAKSVLGDMSATLYAWYLPLPMDDWPSLVEDAAHA